MKKSLIMLVAFLTLGTTLAANAQELSREQRQERRDQRQAAFTAQIKSALASQNFTFTAQQMQTTYGPMVSINSVQSFVDVYPNYLDVTLPYQSYSVATPNPAFLNFTSSDYKYVASVSEDGSTGYVTIYCENVVNLQSVYIPQNYSYTIHMEVVMANGSTTVTISPSFSSQIQYFGTIQANN